LVDLELCGNRLVDGSDIERGRGGYACEAIDGGSDGLVSTLGGCVVCVVGGGGGLGRTGDASGTWKRCICRASFFGRSELYSYINKNIEPYCFLNK
jgi:hypothetical protein